MRQIIILRHAEKQGDDITKKGAEAALKLTSKVGPIDIVTSSTRQRTQKTAQIIANKPPQIDSRANPPAFPDDQVKELRKRQQEHELGIIGIIWENEEFIALAKQAGLHLQDLVADIFKKLDSGQKALIVTHDGAMVALEKLLKEDDFAESPTHTYGELTGFVVFEDMTVKRFMP